MWRVTSLLALGNGAESVQLYSDLLRKDPNSAQAAEFLALSNLMTNRLDQMQEPLDRLKRLKRPDLVLRWQGAMSIVKGDYSSGVESLNRLFLESSETRRLRNAFWLLFAEGEAGAIDSMARRAESCLKLPVVRGGEGYAADLFLACASIFSVCKRSRDLIRDLVRKALDYNSGPARAFQAGVILSRSGSIAEARRILDGYFGSADTLRERLCRLRLRAYIALAGGDALGAMAMFEEARKLKANRIEPEWGLILANAAAGNVANARTALAEFEGQRGFYWWWAAPELAGARGTLVSMAANV